MKMTWFFSGLFLFVFSFAGKTQSNAIGFYDSLFVVNHPEVNRYGDSIIAVYERAALKTLQEMEEELARKQADYELYKDSSFTFIGCGGSMSDLDQIFEYKKQNFLQDKETLRIWFKQSTLKNLNETLIMISNRDNLAFLIDKYRNDSMDEIVTPGYTKEILTELIRRNNAPLVVN